MIDGIFGLSRSRETLEEKAAEIEGRMQYARASCLRDYLDSTQGLLMYHMGMADVVDVEPQPSACVTFARHAGIPNPPPPSAGHTIQPSARSSTDLTVTSLPL